ncbi:MAG: hypothetical protein K2H20_03550 [Bacilli bacterium]|nr:hypothetical protein [Bacilli bacterium]
MTGFSAKVEDLEQSSIDLRTASEDLHSLFEDYANNFMRSAGVAYEEGTEVYNALHDGVEEALRRAEEEVALLAEHSAKASTTAGNLEEAESSSVSRIRSNIG